MLICDRDAKWSAPVRARLGEAGIRVVQTPFQAPNANAYAERFVRSIKHECLNRVIPVGERHLRRTIAEYVEHYHRERNHQGLANELIDGPSAIARDGRIRSPSATRRAAQLLLSRGVMRGNERFPRLTKETLRAYTGRRETFADLRHSLLRARAFFRGIVNASSGTRTRA